MKDSAELDLKAALSLENEIAEELESWKRASAEVAERASADTKAAWDAGVWKGLGASAKELYSTVKIGSERQAILKKVEQAISFATNAKALDPGVSVIQAEGGMEVEATPDLAIGWAYCTKGIVFTLAGQYKEAQAWFGESLKTFPTTDAQLRLACVVAAQGSRNDAITEFQRVIDMDATSEEAVEARKALAELQRRKPRKWSTALLLSIFLGFWGVDRFYLGYILYGIIKFFTVGGFFVWWIIDIVRIASNTLRDADGMRLDR